MKLKTAFYPSSRQGQRAALALFQARILMLSSPRVLNSKQQGKTKKAVYGFRWAHFKQ